MVSADSHRIPRAPCYWGSRQRSRPGSAYGAVTRCGPPSQGVRLPDRFDALRPAPGGDGNSAPRQHRTRNPRRVIARARFSHHPLPLATTHGISTPAGTEMFHFPASPPAPYELQTRVTPHNGRRVPPFGNPRITARKPAPRGISQATTSFIGPRCQGIHRTLKNQRTAHNTQQRISRRTQAPARHSRPSRPCAARRTHAPRPPPPPTNERTGRTNEGPKGAANQNNNKKTFLMLASTMQFTTNPPEIPQPRHTPPKPAPGRTRGAESEGDRPDKNGGPEPRAHRPRTRQRATPPQQRLRGGAGVRPGRQEQEPPRGPRRPATPCSRPNRFETP